MVRERTAFSCSGWTALAGCAALLAASAGISLLGIQSASVMAIFVAFIGLLACAIGLRGLLVVNPNEARVLQFFGTYIGTVKTPGLRWAVPFATRRTVSLRIRDLESERLKTNDRDGNPIEIVAVVVWRVVDTAQALFQVDNIEHLVRVRIETALRQLATAYPYDARDDGQVSLRDNIAVVADHLRKKIQEQLSAAGVEVIEVRISRLAAAPVDH